MILSVKTSLCLLLGLALTLSLAIFWQPPIPQDPTYHYFADTRTFFGIANFFDVVSNIGFVLVGAYALLLMPDKLSTPENPVAGPVFWLGILLVGLGSGYYHFWPNNQTLVWDRLPMTIGFMALFSLILSQSLSAKLGRVLLWPLMLLGTLSVGYWYWGELQGEGDLRLYALVQFFPILAIVFLLITRPMPTPLKLGYWQLIGFYSLAKVSEHFDKSLYELVGFVSGHTLKHIFAAIGLWLFLQSMIKASGVKQKAG